MIKYSLFGGLHWVAPLNRSTNDVDHFRRTEIWMFDLQTGPKIGDNSQLININENVQQKLCAYWSHQPFLAAVGFNHSGISMSLLFTGASSPRQENPDFSN